MKTNFKLLLGLIILVSITTSVYAGTLPVKTTHNMISKEKQTKLKNLDLYEPGFVYKPTSEGDGYFDVTLYYGVYDVTTSTFTAGISPQNITITDPDFGSYTFPSNTYSEDLGTFYFGGTSGPDWFDVTTDPTEINGEYLSQKIYSIYYQP